jgi:7,8-dihydropterin-6-yl-methyl-4-(beta-D-ribofuranosyl)aminobenzene 5'-phosphate synthase
LEDARHDSHSSILVDGRGTGLGKDNLDRMEFQGYLCDKLITYGPGGLMDLREVDRIEIVTLVDNYVDVLIESTDIVTRPPRAKDGEIPLNTFLGEHGLSLLVTVWHGHEKHTILFDAGYTGIPLLHNAELLGLDLTEIEALVLSHFHMDHTGALNRFLDSRDKPVPIVVHPDAFLYPRFLVLKDGQRQQFPRSLVRSELEERSIEIVESKGPVLLAEGTILVSGEVERRTEFEKGIPYAFIKKEGKELKDPILDDQGIIMRLKDKGLVVVSGCSHAGIINTVLHARKITGEDKVYGVLGGFHLSGPAFEPIVGKTIEALREMNPSVMVPMHCTGWNTINRLFEAFPSEMILNSVGSKITLSSQPPVALP